MSLAAIDIRGLGKQYRVGRIQTYKTLRESIVGGLKKMVRRSAGAADPNTFWALKDISLQIHPGEVVGVIGRNGAGKSTLLKVLSRITDPSTGHIDIRGRVGSLLEVGTGFHPELTGRENIFLNGAILGMQRSAVKKSFDAIVDFSGIGSFVDTAVKRYSSGMYTRLAFAVAAFLEPDILIVDEVLAVGDLEFQKRCLGRMEQVSKDGRTVLLVSHNMSAVASLCRRGILLEQGRVVVDGPVDDAIARYLNKSSGDDVLEWKGAAGDDHFTLERTWMRCNSPSGSLDSGHDIFVGIDAVVHKPIHGLVAGFRLWSSFGYELAYVLFDDDLPEEVLNLTPGPFRKMFRIPANTLAAGIYSIEFDVGIHSKKRIIEQEGKLSFGVENLTGIGRRYQLPPSRGWTSLFRPNWAVNDLDRGSS